MLTCGFSSLWYASVVCTPIEVDQGCVNYKAALFLFLYLVKLEYPASYLHPRKSRMIMGTIYYHVFWYALPCDIPDPFSARDRSSGLHEIFSASTQSCVEYCPPLVVLRSYDGQVHLQGCESPQHRVAKRLSDSYSA